MSKKGGIIATVGISASGKSSWAASMVQDYPENYINVERDKLRNLLFGYTDETISEYYKRSDVSKCEKEITRYHKLVIKEGLSQGKIVIVSDTNLQRKYLQDLRFWNVPVELKWFDIEKDSAIKRDNYRLRTVGEDVINKQFASYKSLKASLRDNPIDFTPVVINNNMDLPPVFIFDMDGTLCHMNGKRSPYDWKLVGQDNPDLATTVAYITFNSLEEEYSNVPKVIVCTGRDGICEKESKQWFKDNHLYLPSKFYIRETGDQRPDWVIKEEMWRDIAKDYHILAMFDDRCQVVDRARALGLKVFQVEYNNF